MSSRLRHASPYPGARQPVFWGLWRFLKNPTPTLPADRRPWRTVGLLLVFELVVALAVAFVIAGPVIDALNPPEPELFNPGSWQAIVGLIIVAVLIAPPFEEVIFRLPLAPYQPALPLVGGVFGLILVVTLFDYPTGLILSLGVLVGLYTVFLLILGFGGLSMWALPKIERIWARHFRWVVYGTAVVFGLIHVTNWQWESFGMAEVAAMPLIASPQLIGGFMLAYVRVRLGMVFAIVSHGAFNALVIPVELLL